MGDKKTRQEALSCFGREENPFYEGFVFRNIRPDEADEAADIEEACFPPNEACSREHMLARIEAAGERDKALGSYLPCGKGKDV